jgi:hypothetical protein
LAETARNRDLKRALQIELDGERGVDAVVKTLTKRLTAIDNARSDLSTVKAREVRSELERIHATIIEKIGTEAPDAALELLWRFINLHQNVLERVFDRSGAMADIFRAAGSRSRSDGSPGVAIVRAPRRRCHEPGSSWKAYHHVKSVITDAQISVNEKFRKPYVIENFCHVVASSNSRRALKMDQHDRRWFYPTLASETWPKEKWDAFYEWLEGPGLGAIKHWAESFGDYVSPGDKAPMTDLKKQLIEKSLSEAQTLAIELANEANYDSKPIAIIMSNIREYVRNKSSEKVFDKDTELRKVMRDAGLRQYEVRLKVGPHKEYVMINRALDDELKKLDESYSNEPLTKDEQGNVKSERNKLVREHITHARDIDHLM